MVSVVFHARAKEFTAPMRSSRKRTSTSASWIRSRFQLTCQKETMSWAFAGSRSRRHKSGSPVATSQSRRVAQQRSHLPQLPAAHFAVLPRHLAATAPVASTTRVATVHTAGRPSRGTRLGFQQLLALATKMQAARLKIGNLVTTRRLHGPQVAPRAGRKASARPHSVSSKPQSSYENRKCGDALTKHSLSFALACANPFS